MTALLKYDAACQAIAEAKTIDEVSDWIDKAAAVREYGRRIKNRQIELDALQIRSDAKRKRGQLLRELKERGQLREGRKKLSSTDDSLPVFTLGDLQITPDESSEEQKIAALDGDSYSRLVARCRAYAEAHPEKHSLNVLKPPPEGGPVNGARSIMGSRHEPDDSLDYFPTPPWATRALIERALPELPANYRAPQVSTAWEPACGEGHMAEVLREYFKTVHASDVHDYGYSDHDPCDFLTVVPPGPVDYVITNPPFKDDGEAFVLRALSVARVGVAMFFRLQWLETIGRYESIFQPHPPALIAQFSERVPLCKGRWEPKGSTATAYLWIVWLKSYDGDTKFFWIPPDCKEVLSKPDDIDRFTAHPVIRREQFDLDTGEITDAPPCSAGPMTAPADAPARCQPEPSSSSGDDLEIPPFLRRTKPHDAEAVP